MRGPLGDDACLLFIEGGCMPIIDAATIYKSALLETSRLAAEYKLALACALVFSGPLQIK